MHDTDYGDFVAEIGYYVLRKCSPTWRIERSCIDFVDLTFVIEGEAEYVINNTPYHVCAGDMLCVPKGSIREASNGPENLMKCFSANFQLRDLDGRHRSLPLPMLFHIGLQPDIIALCQDLNVEWLRHIPGYRLKVRGIFLLILQRVLELTLFDSKLTYIDGRISKVARYIGDHFSEELKIGDFASQFNLNAAYFGTLFKNSMGMSFHQYLIKTRINNAEDMLRSGNYTVGEAAALCGFQDVFYFSRLYKKSRGYPPSSLLKH